jgi:hypothetical protein
MFTHIPSTSPAKIKSLEIAQYLHIGECDDGGLAAQNINEERRHSLGSPLILNGIPTAH